MTGAIAAMRGLSRESRTKALLLSSWFFVTIATLWLLKAIRQASLLADLGAQELPYVRFGSVIAVALIVAVYSRTVDRLSRLQVAKGANFVFAAVLVVLWTALRLGGDELGRERWFVWLVFILVDVYSTVMVGIFWTYTNDVCTREEADRIYGPIGLGGILGGIAGGALVDGLVVWIGQVDILLVCVGLMLVCAAIVARSESRLHPPARTIERDRAHGASILDGARLVVHSRYLLLIVGIVLSYEFAAATTDFVVNIVFERAYTDKDLLAKMFGRLGWVVSGAALVSQVFVVPALLPRKRLALLLPPLVMTAATVGFAIVPVAVAAFVMSAADRGLNYSLQQSTKETLYVPLSDSEKYKAKAFIDMLLDRFAKALSSVALMIAIAASGLSIEVSLAIALGALAIWLACAAQLGRAYPEVTSRRSPPRRRTEPRGAPA